MTPDKVEAALGVLKGIKVRWNSLGECEEYQKSLSVLTEALAESRRDAARYRFVRDGKSRGMVDLCITEVTWGDTEEHEILTDTKADTAIDAAMKETP